MINKDFKTIDEIRDIFNSEEKCIKQLELIRWGNKVLSPFDLTSKVYKCSNGLYKCKNTGKYFNVKTGTIFDNTKVSLKDWFLAIWYVTYFKGKVSMTKLCKELNVSPKTGILIFHKLKQKINY